MKFAVIGSGSWGTALAQQLAYATEQPVALLCRNEESAETISKGRENVRYLPGHKLHERVEVLGPNCDLQCAETVLFVLPSSVFREEVQAWRGRISEQALLVSCTKGIEANSGKTMSVVLKESFANNPIAVLSGPNHAEEVMEKKAAATVIGCKSEPLAAAFQEQISSPWFRAYRSTDMLGIELGGALKNVYALAAGIAEGLELGDNARAAMLTRALSEMSRLGAALGGQKETFMGLSGIGDLMTTAYSEHSRNHRTGRALGSGMQLEEAIASLNGMIAEGVPNASSAYQLLERVPEVDAPIIREVHAIVYEGKACGQAMSDLLTRELRAEAD